MSNLSSQPLKIICIVGPSASGKTTLACELVNKLGNTYKRWTQTTTRARRPADSDSDYLFISKPVYDNLFPGLVCTTSFDGNSYGTIPEVNDGRFVVIIADKNGLNTLTEYASKTGAELFKVLVKYDITEEEMKKRNRSNRSVEFAMKELNSFADYEFDLVLDSSSEGTEVFLEKSIPLIAAMTNDTMREVIKQRASAVLNNLHSISKDATTSLHDFLGDFCADNKISVETDETAEDLSPVADEEIAPAEGLTTEQEPNTEISDLVEQLTSDSEIIDGLLAEESTTTTTTENMEPQAEGQAPTYANHSLSQCVGQMAFSQYIILANLHTDRVFDSLSSFSRVFEKYIMNLGNESGANEIVKFDRIDSNIITVIVKYKDEALELIWNGKLQRFVSEKVLAY